MDPKLVYKFLVSKLKTEKNATLLVSGTSMNPMMHDGDSVTIQHCNAYSVGDVLVFIYKGELLIHRLLKRSAGLFFCKGDNSFRLEDVKIENIAGKVIFINGETIPPFPDDCVRLSYLVNREFRKNGYDIEMTKKSGIYRFYHQCAWKKEDYTLKYRLSSNASIVSLLDMFVTETENLYEIELLHSIINNDFIESISDFCDFKMLAMHFSKLDPSNTQKTETQTRLFLTKGILGRLIEVI